MPTLLVKKVFNRTLGLLTQFLRRLYAKEALDKEKCLKLVHNTFMLNRLFNFFSSDKVSEPAV